MYIFSETKGNATADVESSNGQFQASITINGHTGHIKDFDDQYEAIEYAKDLLKRAV